MRKSTLREYTESILIAAILALFIRTFVFQAFKIPTGSMEDNLLVGDHILVNKFVYGPVASDLEELLLPVRDVERGDVVVFRAPQDPSKDFIKRVVGLPGEEVEVEGGVVHVDGEPLEEPYTYHDVAGGYHHDTTGPETIPRDHYYVLGDNRDNSRDSRYWGTVPEPFIKGQALLVYWSYDAPQSAYLADSVSRRLVEIGKMLLNFFTKTRWERTFHLIR